MGYYRVYGKEYYGELSDFFEEVVEANSSEAALYRFAFEVTGLDNADEIDWVNEKPKALEAGWVRDEPTFWSGCGHLFEIRRIVPVQPATVTCPTCHGAGQTDGYIELDPAASSK